MAVFWRYDPEVGFDLCVYRKLNPNVMVMKFAKDGVQYDASGPLNWARDRGIFIQ